MNVLVRVMHFTDVNMLRPVEMEFISCHLSFHHVFMETVKQAAAELQDLHLWFNSLSHLLSQLCIIIIRITLIGQVYAQTHTGNLVLGDDVKHNNIKTHNT